VVTKKDKQLAAAQKYLERGSFEKALAMFQEAVKEDPKDTRTWLRMAEVYVRLGKTDKATEVYQKTVDLYVEQGFFQRAVAVYKNIIKLSPDFVEARIKLADVFRRLGLMSDAVQQLEQAAASYQKHNRLPEALSAIKQIIDFNPEQANAHIRYAETASQGGLIRDAVVEFTEAANLLKTQGRIDEFLRVAERLLHYDPTNHGMVMEVAAKYLDHNNPRPALARLKPAFEANQRDPEVLSLLARTFEQLGQAHKTLPVLKELVRVYAEAGRISERNHTAQRVLAMDPNDAEMLELLGQQRGGMAAMAQPAYASRPAALPIPNVTPLPTAGVGKRPVAITFGEMEVPPSLRAKYFATPAEPMPATMSERIDIASGMVEKSDDDPEVKRILAEADVFVKYGLVERAADHLRRVFERVPTHTGAHERLAVVLVQLDRKTEAAAEYEVLARQSLASKPKSAADYARKALELDPTSQRALEVLGVIEGSMPEPATPSVDSSISSDLHINTPEPEIIESDEIELLHESVDSNEFEPESSSGTAFDPLPPSTDAALAGLAGLPDEASQDPVSPEIPASGSAADESLLADLEQVDFFIEQGLATEAAAMLDELESKAPGHILLADRRDKLAALGTSAQSSQGAMPAQVHGEAAGSVPHRRAPTAAPAHAQPAGHDPHDINTHADLGIMEKTMERYDAAIEHFKAVMADPKREVFALSMIGECSEALGDSAEAIRCYQDALKRPHATSTEATQLYYQLGNVFYNLGDQSEALYYFERVYKRNANFRDVQQRLSDLKSRAASR
jgi:tetratricopeptide (TPR) repeat protein